MIQSQNPYSEKIEKTFKSISDKEIARKIDLANKAFISWKEVSMKKRAMLMKNLGKVLRKNKQKYGELITREMGKPISQSIAEIEKCALNCDYYAENAEAFICPEIYNSEYKHARVELEPMGVIFAVMPWNFPFWQVIRFAAPALMAGNVGVLKHASNVPQCALAIEEAIIEAGFPKDVFKTLLADSSQVEKIISNPLVKAVTITGSEYAGIKVAEAAGRNLKKLVLELGGADPFIILKDADLEKAAEAAVKSRMINTGQSCIDAKRFIIEAPVADKVIPMLIANMQKLVAGDPMISGTEVGPLARKDLRDELHEQVKQSIKKGSKAVLGGNIPGGKGFFYEPTILLNVKKGMPASDAELFGPVMSVIVVKDEAEAIRVANDHIYGLGSAVWSKNEKKALRVARALEAGMVAINDFSKSDPRFPFGGTKKSGYGRELGSYGIKEFMNVKTIICKE
jgi:succinate-semialdehyde dehydrogenase/glutarate-semialdehyde dehydrogenase